MGDTHTVTVNDDRFQVIRHPAEGEEGSSLWLTLKSGVTLDFEDDAGSTIMLTLTVTDSNGGSATADVVIEVMNVNEAPMATGELPVVIGTAGEALAGDQTRIDLGMFFEDPDAGDTLTYAATGGPGWLDFEVDEETGHGVLSGAPPAAGPDAEASHTVTITATDGGGLSASRSFTLVVDDGNDPISDIGFTDADGKALPTNNLEISFEENKEGEAGGTLLGTFSAEDPDSEDHPNGMITWSLPPGRWSSSFEIDPESGELRLREGESLNFEEASDNVSNREIPLSVRATDGGDPKMSRTEVLYIEVTDANDAPKAVDTDISIGWWVTRDEDKETGDDPSDSDYAGEGEWLTFRLETAPRDQRPAFSDLDVSDRLTYTLVDSPSWLQIDPRTGLMENRAGMVADEGLYTVTVRATDTGGATDDFTFRLAVAESDFELSNGVSIPAGGVANPDDNDDPEIDADDADVLENAQAGDVVATFEVEDDELPLGPFHPWGRVDVHVEATHDPDEDEDDDDSVMLAIAQVGEEAEPFDHYFTVHHTGTEGNTASYEVRLTAWGVARWIDADEPDGDEVTFTIKAADGTFDPGTSLGDGLGDPASAVPDEGAPGEGADRVTVTVDIDDVDEAPALERPINGAAGNTDDKNTAPLPHTNTASSRLPLTFQVEQQDDEGYIFLNLSDMIRDPEGDALDADQYGAAIAPGAPWLSFARVLNNDEGGMRTGPQLWEDIETSANSGAVRIGNANVGWLDIGAVSQDDATDPADKDIVLILRVDRHPDDDGGSEAQDADAVLTVTATDGDNTGETTIVVAIGDENTDAPNEDDDPSVVTLSGPPREGSKLTATFHEERDPDFTGTEALDENPILVRYQWFTSERAYDTDADEDGRPSLTGDVGDSDREAVHEVPELRQETTENHEDMTGMADYTVRQSDVGGKIQGRVIYYELYDGEIVQSEVDDPDTEGTVEGFVSAETAEVINTPDVETMSFAVETALVGSNGDDIAANADAGDIANGTHVLRITPEYSPNLFVQERDRPVNEDGDVVAIPAADASEPAYGYNFNYEWQYSPNGRTLWEVIRDLDESAVDDDRNVRVPDPDGRQLELPESVEGGYVRLVVIYEDEGDGRDNQVENRVNRIESDPVKVGDITHVLVGPADSQLHIETSPGTAPTSGTVILPGWTLQIAGLADVPGGSSKVEWLLDDRVVGEGREYTVSASLRDPTAGESEFTARVTRYDEDGGLVSKTTVSLPTGVALTRNVDPLPAQAGAHFVDLGKAPDDDGEYAMLTGEIKLQSLFTDPEGDRLRFDIRLPLESIFGTEGTADLISDGIPGNTLNLYFDNNRGDEDADTPVNGPLVADGIRDNDNGDQLLLTDQRSGRIEYHTTRAQNHDRDVDDQPAENMDDGMGNYIEVIVAGTDSSPGTPFMTAGANPTDPSVTVNLRIDAAPTTFHVSANVGTKTAEIPDNAANADNLDDDMMPGDETSGTMVTERPITSLLPFDYGSGDGRAFTYFPYTVREHNGDDVVIANAAGEQVQNARVIARIDVQDDNEASHAYGQYTFTVDGDDRFEVVVDPADASQGILRLKTGENLDFEALESPARMLNPDNTSYVIDDDERSIDLVVTATPVDPDGSDPHDPITLGVRVDVINVAEASDPNANDVPGLEDHESDDDGTGDDAGTAPSDAAGDDTDTTDDSGVDADDDGDHDGGWWEVATLDDGLF